MKTKAITEYGIRVMLFLAQNQGVKSKTEIVRQTEVPAGFFNKLIQELKKAGAVNSVTGQYGGYYLNVDAEVFSLLDIYDIFEERMVLAICKNGEENCDMYDDGFCPINQVNRDINAYFAKTLSEQTLSKLVRASKKSSSGFHRERIAPEAGSQLREGQK